MGTKDIFPSWRGDGSFDSPRIALWTRLVLNDPAMTKIIADHPFEALEARLASPVHAHSYHAGADAIALVEQVDEAARPIYLCAFLLWRMGQFASAFTRAHLHPEFKLQYTDSYRRMMEEMEAGTFVADIRRDVFVKDMGLVRLVLIPAVAQVIYPRSGIQLKPVLRWGPAGWLFVWGACGDRKPFLEIHTHEPMIGPYFNPAGWEETYRLAALILQYRPKVRGLAGFSWFYDPALQEMSPRLEYLRRSPVNAGAKLMPMGPDEDSVSLATATSPSRLRAYQDGTYVPTRYGLIWSRGDLMKYYL